ncbi:MAG: hypothetical protein KH234_06285 [Subdoligranulum variabile]|nr:hypothetical protein [Subdoligranulum variabile]
MSAKMKRYFFFLIITILKWAGNRQKRHFQAYLFVQHCPFKEKNCLPAADSTQHLQDFFHKEKSVSQRPVMAENRQKQTLSGNCFLFVTVAVGRPNGSFPGYGRIFLAQKAVFCTK